MAKLSLANDPLRSSSEEGAKRLKHDPFHVTGGDGALSYFKNSFLQKLAEEGVKGKMEDEIIAKFDVENFLSSSNTIRLVDLGCAVGPNTFLAMQDILQAIKKKYHLQRPGSGPPEFQVFFNDQPSNDFNTFFRSLPEERDYFASAVSGSFHGRLFPESSIHFVHCAHAMHWLSRVPEEVADEKSAAWNRGRVHYVNAAKEVVRAYGDQFGEDMGRFLDARAKEIVGGGMMTVIMPGIPDGMAYSELTNGVMYELLGCVFIDMVSEGLINEDQVDAFNLPIYAPSPSEISSLVEANDHFTLEKLELNNPAPWLNGPIDIPVLVTHVRTAMEEMFLANFENDVVDAVFSRLTNKLLEQSERMESGFWKRTLLFLVLMRKMS